MMQPVRPHAFGRFRDAGVLDLFRGSIDRAGEGVDDLANIGQLSRMVVRGQELFSFLAELARKRAAYSPSSTTRITGSRPSARMTLVPDGLSDSP
jgi:hypothetical protein